MNWLDRLLDRILDPHREYVTLPDGSRVNITARDLYLTHDRNDPAYREWQAEMRKIRS